ncbi:MAG: hypothetical protein AB7O38_09495, partial [Pirellulaceae bacterium]
MATRTVGRLGDRLAADGIEVRGTFAEEFEEILTPAALRFVAGLEREFRDARRERLAARQQRQLRLDAGELPDFLAVTGPVRLGTWRVAPLPADLQDRRVEITGPVDRKMEINAVISGANCF